MTAEIAVLNKLAVTLAADSAVTIGSGASTKVYNSADKIFEATKFDAIGIMVYNNPELNGVPVESIVKMYRDRHCRGNFRTVFEFADAFLQHIKDLPTPVLTISENIKRLVLNRVFVWSKILSEQNTEFFQDIGSGKRDVDPENLVAALDAEQSLLVDAEIGRLFALETPEWADEIGEVEVYAHHGDDIGEIVDLAFQNIALGYSVRDKLVRLAGLSLLKEFDRSTVTGLVFAGFGSDEIFPSLVSWEILGLVAGKLKKQRTKYFDVDRTLHPDAAIFPFAQQEMVDRFMYGLDNDFLDLSERYFAGALTKLKTNITEALGVELEPLTDAISPAIDAILDEFRTSLVEDHLARSREQLSDMVRSMPKQELAALAESLVHITSLKRKFSAGAESVGGPIDVAMITRAEGLVWVKRKHYFDPGLNPRYFYRRYGHGAASAASADGSLNQTGD